LLNLAASTMSPTIMGAALANASISERKEMVRVAAVEVKGTVMALTKNLAKGMVVGAAEQRFIAPAAGISMTGHSPPPPPSPSRWSLSS
jgi:transketolase C-terminal domain/subunit